MSAWTPGPWKVECLDRTHVWIMANLGDKRGDIYLAEIICSDEAGKYVKNNADRQANARLMAAAPAMYKLLASHCQPETVWTPDYLEEFRARALCLLTAAGETYA